ncbi:MAG: Abi family protein [Chlorobium sp.]|nr:Abi family protein [Chlorobium sp.]
MSNGQKQNYCKPALTIDQQLDLLVARGLTIPDRDKARHYLNYIGYYRLSGYFLTFQQSASGTVPHSFKKDITFKDILDCYIFDRELRLLVMDAIERIEVAFRACISNTMSENHGPHWFMDSSHFIPRFKHAELLDRIKRETFHSSVTSARNHPRRESFIHHYYETYSHPDLPPSWMVVEVMSLGTLSSIYASLASRDMQKIICQTFGINHLVMESWLHTLTYLRNLCAHHARLWNRQFSIKPTIMKAYQKQLGRNATFYAQAAMLYVLMYIIADGSQWQRRLAELLDKHPHVFIPAMGFPEGWKEDPFWRIA